FMVLNRIGRTERSGRYGSEQSRDESDWRDRRERDQDRDHSMRHWSEERRFERYEGDRRGTRDSPEQRERKRRNSDRSEDGYHSDGDYPDQDYRREPGEDKKSKTIMLGGLAPHVTEEDIRFSIDQLEGPQPVDVRLMKKRTGISRGFAFVDFYHLQDATRWMETNQKRLVIQGKVVDMHYSHPRNKYEDWLCNTCGLYNFRRRLKCFRCGEVCGFLSLTAIILRNIAPLTTVESILTALAPYANLSANNIRLIKDKQTGQNRGFAFVQLSSPLEASQLLTILQGLQPPLKLDGKTIGVDFAKSARKDLLLPDGNRVSAFSVASTAIAAAQWSSTQVTLVYYGPEQLTFPYSTRAMNVLQDYQSYYHQGAATSTSQGNGLLGGTVAWAWHHDGVSPSGCQSPITMDDGIVHRHNPNDFHILNPFKSVLFVFFYPTAVPDISTYQYDESSGYYYDPQTGLYYDPNSHYYYNVQTQQYLYWDTEKQTYVPAPANINTEQNEKTADGSAASSSKEPKEKKEKPKSKTAQQIAKDMERWAKSLNKQKENFKSSFQPISQEERKEAAAADAGYSLFERKAGLDRLIHEASRMAEEEAPCGLVAAYSGDSDPEEGGAEPDGEGGQDKLTDWKKLACLLCRRQFPNKDSLVRHQQLSDLHKKNLEVLRRSKMTEAELEELERKESEAQLRTKGAGLGTKGTNYTLSPSDTYKDAVRKAMFARFTELE
uniref:RNA binding motif protein 5 n=1 Tax=Oryzias latipes TaxID=8090 RepID=A0A3P9IBI2_ORYLA